MRFAALFLVLLAAVGAALGVALVRWAERTSAREFRHRLALLGLLVLTVVGIGVAAPTEFPAGSPMAAVETAAGLALTGLLVLLWAYWLRAERRSS